MDYSIGKRCAKCGHDQWSCIDNIDCYYESCRACHALYKFNKQQYLNDFECPECGALSGTPEENKTQFAIRCNHCGRLFVQFEKASNVIDNRLAAVPIAKCPTCGSINIRRISTTRKIFGVATLGLASNSIGKTMECKKCGYKW